MNKMNTKFFYIFLVIVIILAFSACKKEKIEQFEIVTEKVTPQATSASIKGTVKCSVSIEEMAVILSTDEAMSEADQFNVQLDGTSFSITIDNLIPGTVYFYHYIVKFGSDKEFVTDNKSFSTVSTPPIVQSLEIIRVNEHAVRLKGLVVSDGGKEVTERGVCWNTYGDPNTDDSYQIYTGNNTGEFTCQVYDLESETIYYLRAYAKNEIGIGYGEVFEYTTDSIDNNLLPVVQTLDITDITTTSAKAHCVVTDQGSSAVTERGVCWGTEPGPTISGSHADSGLGLGEYEITMADLMPSHTYYVRSYAKNNEGIAYGDELSFTTAQNSSALVVMTLSVTNITQNSAIAHGRVTGDGGAEVTERGVCWSTSHNPTMNNFHASIGTGMGDFEVEMTDLDPNTLYYFRAYALNANDIAYGEEKSFVTLQNLSIPTVITLTITDITQTSAIVNGNVTGDGGADVTERGACWSTSHNPTISDSHASNGTGTGNFTVFMTGLTANTHYYVRAYAKNSVGVSYGNEVEFTTSQSISAPTVMTGEVTNIGQNTALCSGNVTDDGGAPVTERGVCWSTSHNPTISDSHNMSGTGIGGFTVPLNGLTANTHYYVRAYAKNSAGTSYGNELSFTTLPNTNIPIGAVSGLFSVSDNQQVYFSQGNLQYIGSDPSPYWKFADHQWEFFGDNGQGSPLQSMNRDLFGWGTSGWDCGNTYFRPYDTDNSSGSGPLYGPSGQHSLTGSYANSDWGIYNAISNGGNIPGQWRTLSRSEWYYVFNQRRTDYRFVKGQITGIDGVNMVNGIILLPDDWKVSDYPLYGYNENNSVYESNTISLADWNNVFEPAGAVFLPASGGRHGSSLYNINEYGYYWSTEFYNSIYAYSLFFGISVAPDHHMSRNFGHAIRLVCPATN